jgi:hypothetical protein
MKTKQPSDKKVCESCGKEFSCGANIGKCWCFDIETSEKTLSVLREDFKDCLCRDCLAGKFPKTDHFEIS